MNQGLVPNIAKWFAWKYFCKEEGRAENFVAALSVLEGRQKTLLLLHQGETALDLEGSRLDSSHGFVKLKIRQATAPAWRPLSGVVSSGSELGIERNGRFRKLGTAGCVVTSRRGDRRHVLTAGHVVWKLPADTKVFGQVGSFRIGLGRVLDQVIDHSLDAAVVDVEDTSVLVPSVPIQPFLSVPWWGRTGVLVRRLSGRGVLKECAEVLDHRALVSVDYGREECQLQRGQIVLWGSDEFANKGDSGSVVVDEAGRAVGLLTAMARISGGSLYLATPISRALRRLRVRMAWGSTVAAPAPPTPDSQVDSPPPCPCPLVSPPPSPR